MTKFEKLLMTIELLDEVSAPAKGIMRTLDRLQHHSKMAFSSIAKGFATVTAVSAITIATLLPAGDVYAALGEVKSLGVGKDGLTALRHESSLFASQWGDDSGTFIRSAYDIQSAIAGLSEKELPSATRSAGILAKATKANVSDMTSYFGSMYGIFQKQADAMGKSQWLEQLAGKTAAAVQIFKTTGPAMQQAFQSLGQGATNAGASLDEQIAILGTLQAAMEAGVAGTSFKSFEAGISNGAGQKLGLDFTDSSGKMLPVLDILEKLEGKFGKLQKTADRGLVQKAFGQEGLKFVDALIQKQGLLKKNIADIGKQQSIDKAIEMAEAMTMPWDRIVYGTKALIASIGFDSLSSAIPILNNIADAIGTTIEWSQKYPLVNKEIATTLGYVMSIGAAIGGIWIAIGVFHLMALALSPFKFLLIPIIGLFKALRVAWLGYLMAKSGLGVIAAARFAMATFATQVYANVMANKLMRISLWLLNSTLFKSIAITKAFAVAQWSNVIATSKYYLALGRLSVVMALTSIKTGVMTAILLTQNAAMTATTVAGNLLGGAMRLMKLAFLTSIPAIAAFSAALWANPLTWIAAAIIAVGVGLYFLITRWDTVVAAFRNNAWMQTLFFPLYMGVELIDWVLKNLDKIPQWFTSLKQWIGSLNVFDVVGNGVDWLIGKINLIPGINIETSSTKKHQEELKNALPSLQERQASDRPNSGGLMQQFGDQYNSSNKGNHIEKIEVHNHGKGTSAQDLEYEFEMASA